MRKCGHAEDHSRRTNKPSASPTQPVTDRTQKPIVLRVVSPSFASIWSPCAPTAIRWIGTGSGYIKIKLYLVNDLHVVLVDRILVTADSYVYSVPTNFTSIPGRTYRVQWETVGGEVLHRSQWFQIKSAASMGCGTTQSHPVTDSGLHSAKPKRSCVQRTDSQVHVHNQGGSMSGVGNDVLARTSQCQLDCSRNCTIIASPRSVIQLTMLSVHLPNGAYLHVVDGASPSSPLLAEYKQNVFTRNVRRPYASRGSTIRVLFSSEPDASRLLSSCLCCHAYCSPLKPMMQATDCPACTRLSGKIHAYLESFSKQKCWLYGHRQ